MRESEIPEVAALCKKARGETLTDEESALRTNAARRPVGTGAVPHKAVEAMLEDCRRTGG
jgi:hypothetical protein